MKDGEKIQEIVRQVYGSIARGDRSGCCGESSACCGPGASRTSDEVAKAIGYSEEELSVIPGEANLGLGCGNPTALAGLRPGETILDLGSGAGFDCFLAADRVGPGGRVIGVDMTGEMVAKAKENAAAAGIENVEFRLGEIEKLPVEDDSVDVVLSNCVINLSADKASVFREIKRVLKPGGRVSISDIVLLGELPEEVLNSIEAYTGCVSGAVHVDEYRRLMEKAGLEDIRITTKDISPLLDQFRGDPMVQKTIDSLGDAWLRENLVTSALVEATA